MRGVRYKAQRKLGQLRPTARLCFARRRLMIARLMGPVGLGSLRARIFAMVAAIFVAVLPSASAQTRVNEAERSTVRIAVIAETNEGRMLYGTGSGFLVAPNLVVTNAHVVAPARTQASFGVAIVPPAGEGLLPARLVAYSALDDLALLEFRGGPAMPPVTISTLTPHAGDAIIALGYPDVDDLERPAEELIRPTPPSRTTGSIASLRDRAPTGDPIPTINHTSAISSGSSGGPLIDECGRVIGVNTWHARGQDTQESRAVASRASILIDFLEQAGVAPLTSDQRCLSFAERVEAERAATVDALETQNRDLTAKLEAADRLTRIAVVILLGGTLSLLVAVVVLGLLLLSRHPKPHPEHHEAPHPAPHPPRRTVGVAAVVGGAVAAALIVTFAGIALLRGGAPGLGQDLRFAGNINCAYRAQDSLRGDGTANTSFTVSGRLCVNGRTLYAPVDGGHYQRAVLSGGAHALDVLTIDPDSGIFKRERFPLSDQAFAQATEAAGAASAEGCDGAGAQHAVTARNQSLMRFAAGEPSQRLVWKCEPAKQ